MAVVSAQQDDAARLAAMRTERDGVAAALPAAEAEADLAEERLAAATALVERAHSAYLAARAAHWAAEGMVPQMDGGLVVGRAAGSEQERARLAALERETEGAWQLAREEWTPVSVARNAAHGRRGDLRAARRRLDDQIPQEEARQARRQQERDLVGRGALERVRDDLVAGVERVLGR